MAGRARTALAALLCAGLAAFAVPTGVSAVPAPAAVPIVDHPPTTAKTSISAGSKAAVTSPPLSATATSVAIGIKRDQAQSDSWESQFTTLMTGMTNREKLLTCASLGLVGLNQAATDPVQGGLAASVYLSAAIACFSALRQSLAVRGATKATACGPLTTVQVPIAVSRSSAGYAVNLTGPVRAARPKFRVKCTVAKDGNLALRIKAKKGKTLRKVLGPALNVGFAASPTLPAPVPLTVNFGQPR